MTSLPALQDPANNIHPDYYTEKVSDIIKSLEIWPGYSFIDSHERGNMSMKNQIISSEHLAIPQKKLGFHYWPDLALGWVLSPRSGMYWEHFITQSFPMSASNSVNKIRVRRLLNPTCKQELWPWRCSSPGFHIIYLASFRVICCTLCWSYEIIIWGNIRIKYFPWCRLTLFYLTKMSRIVAKLLFF